MPFSFPSSPSIGDKSTQNSREYEWSGYAWEIVATPAALSASVITSGTFDAARLPLATTVAAGAVIVGTGLGVSSGTVSVTYGTSAGTTCQGNDSRLSDTRTPTDGSVTTAKIANDAVTYAKLQNVSATDRLLGRSSAGSGDVEEILCTSFGRSLIGSADAASARSTLSVQPTASPAFTGAATVTNDGNVVPLTVTNTGTANSFVVNDASGDTTPFVIDANGRVVIGGTAASSEGDVVSVINAAAATGNVSRLFVARASAPSSSTSAHNGFQSSIGTDAASFTVSALRHFIATQGTLGAGSSVTDQYGFAALSTITGATNNYGFYSDIASGTGRWNFYANGTAANYFGGQVQISAGSVSACGVAFSGDVNTGLAQIGGADTASLVTAGVERVRVDASGNVGVGNIVPTHRIDCNGEFRLRGTGASTEAGKLHLYWVSSTNRATWTTDASGNALIETGSSSPAERFRVGVNGRSQFFAASEKYGVQLNNGSTANGPFIGSAGADIFTVSASGGAELLRVDASGNTCIGSAGSSAAELSVFKDKNAARTAILIDNLDQRLRLSCYYESGVGQYAEIQSATDSESSFQNLLLQRQGGEVLIGTTTDNGAYKLQVNSQIYATNATIATSDARFKTNVESLTDATTVIEALRPVAFDFLPHAERNFATERQVGLIAQEAQSALAGTDYAASVVAQCGDHLGLAYEKLVPVLIRALQESNARIAALEERLSHA